MDICSTSALRNTRYPRGPGAPKLPPPSPEPFFSTLRRFREPAFRRAGSGGGWWGRWGTRTRRRRRFAGCGWTESSDRCPGVWSRQGCARLHRARRQRNERGADEAPAAGPMASSCASIDIEDATQHLRDILKLDRPAGGEPGERGWAFGERAEGRRGPQGPQVPQDPYRIFLADEVRRGLEQ